MNIPEPQPPPAATTQEVEELADKLAHEFISLVFDAVYHQGGVTPANAKARILPSLHAFASRQQQAQDKERADYEQLLGKGAEAMGFIRFIASDLGLAGPEWSEEPGFAQKLTAAWFKMPDKVLTLRKELRNAEAKVGELSITLGGTQMALSEWRRVVACERHEKEQAQLHIATLRGALERHHAIARAMDRGPHTPMGGPYAGTQLFLETENALKETAQNVEAFLKDQPT